MSAEDTCKPGDPDPTPIQKGYTYDLCINRLAINRRDGLWCTRERGHIGQHVAGTGEQVTAVWP